MNDKDYDKLFSNFKGEVSDLLPLLIRIQEKLGYVSEDAVRRISRFLKIFI